MFRKLLVAVSLVAGPATAQPCASPSFALPVDLGIPFEERPWNLTSADVDGDSRPDVLAYLPSGRVVVFWNRAGGLFRGLTTEVAVDPRHLRFQKPADLDGDGRVDLLVVAETDEPSSRRLESWLGDGAGGFASAASLPLDAGVDLGLALLRIDGGALPDVLSIARSDRTFRNCRS